MGARIYYDMENKNYRVTSDDGDIAVVSRWRPAYEQQAAWGGPSSGLPFVLLGWSENYQVLFVEVVRRRHGSYLDNDPDDFLFDPGIFPDAWAVQKKLMERLGFPGETSFDALNNMWRGAL